jgi:hypothetical protein
MTGTSAAGAITHACERSRRRMSRDWLTLGERDVWGLAALRRVQLSRTDFVFRSDDEVAKLRQFGAVPVAGDAGAVGVVIDPFASSHLDIRPVRNLDRSQAPSILPDRGMTECAVREVVRRARNRGVRRGHTHTLRLGQGTAQPAGTKAPPLGSCRSLPRASSESVMLGSWLVVD